MKIEKYIDEKIYSNIKNSLSKHYEYNIKTKPISNYDYLLSGHFIPNEIKTWINNNVNSCSNVKNNTTNINIYNDQNNKIDISYNLIFSIIDFLNCNNKKITIHIFPTPFKKKITDNCKHLKPLHINSGFTDHLYEHIVIFRFEEMYKVLIHELIHLLNHDLIEYNFDVDHINIHNDSFPILINESVTEFITMYYHSMFYSIINNIDDPWTIYLLEIQFTIYQINKIFLFYGINDVTFFSKPNEFIQETSVIPYFIIKYMLMLHTKALISNLGNKTKLYSIVNKIVHKMYNFKIDKCDIIDNSLRMSFHNLII